MGNCWASVCFDELKARGNKVFYKTYLDESLLVSEYKGHMESAIQYYLKAAKYANTQSERASITKNLAITFYRLGERLYRHYEVAVRTLPGSKHEHHFEMVDCYLKMAMVKFEQGQHLSRFVKPTEWRDHFFGRWNDCASLLWELHYNRQSSSDDPLAEQLDRLYSLCSCMQGFWAENYCLWLADMIHQTASQFQIRGEYCKSLQFLRENIECVEQLRRMDGSRRNLGPFKDLPAKLDCLLDIGESAEARIRGDSLWSTGEPPDAMNGRVWEVADWYVRAVALSAGKSVENEAKACCQLGRLYQAASINDKSLEYYQRGFDLAKQLSVDARDQPWYRHCYHALESFRSTHHWKENKDKESLYRSARLDMADQLSELRKVGAKSIADLLDFIYRKYPPKRQSDHHGPETPASPLLTNPKDRLKKALLHYHPDKQDLDRYGFHWMVLCEEITAILNNKSSRVLPQ